MRHCGITGFRNRINGPVRFFLVMSLLVFFPGAARGPQPKTRTPTTAPEILAEGSRLAFLHNWQAAAAAVSHRGGFVRGTGRPTKHLVRTNWKASGGNRIAVVARRIRISGGCAEFASHSVHRRLFCLVAKGDIDFQIDPKSSETVWTEVAAVAALLGESAWENRAQAELGTIAFYKGEIYRGARMVAKSYAVAELHDDTAYVIRLRAAFGEGFAEFGHPKDALVFFDSALKLARQTPDAGFPFTAYLGRGRALVALG